MAITFFGVATTPADNAGSSIGPTITLTPPASMVDGDLVMVSVRYRASTATLSVSNAGGQTWNSTTQYNTTNIRAAVFWCRFNGTWSANPIFTVTSGTNNIDAQMLVFRPTSAAYTWTLESGPNTAAYSAPLTPFTVTVTGRTPTAASTVSVACWHSIDDNSWGNLAGTGWSKTSLGAQYRNNDTADNSSSFAYNIKTSATATNDVSQDQTALGGDAGETALFTWAETLITAAITGNAATSAAGSLARANGEVGLSGLELATAAGTITVPSSGPSNATASVTGAASTLAAGVLVALISSVIALTGVSSTSAVGSPIENTTTLLAGVSSTSAAGTATGIAATAGVVPVGGVVATSAAGLLTTAIPSIGVAGAATTSAAGTLVASGSGSSGSPVIIGVAATSAAGSLAGAVTVLGAEGVQSAVGVGAITAVVSGASLGAGQPAGRFATALAGTITTLTPPVPVGAQTTVIAEPLAASLMVVEIDGVSGTPSAGEVVNSGTGVAVGVSSTSAAGALARITTVVAVPPGVSSSAIVGNLAGTSAGFSVGQPPAVHADAVAGVAQAVWTFVVPVTGAAAAASAGDVLAQNADPIPAEAYPPGVAAQAGVGAVSTGQASVSIPSVQGSTAAGSLRVNVKDPVTFPPRRGRLAHGQTLRRRVN